jgi:hypothetical protein
MTNFATFSQAPFQRTEEEHEEENRLFKMLLGIEQERLAIEKPQQ